MTIEDRNAPAYTLHLFVLELELELVIKVLDTSQKKDSRSVDVSNLGPLEIMHKFAKVTTRGAFNE